MHGAALDWTVLCTLPDGPDLPTGEGFGAGLVRDHAVYKLTGWQRKDDRKFKRILDVGSLDVNGCMRTYNFLGNPPTWLQRVGYDPSFRHTAYFGIDLTEGPNVDAVVDSHNMYFPPATFDLVLCLNMLEHDTDGAATLREIHRVLEPGGEMVLVCTNEHGAEHAHLGGGQKEYFRHWPASELKAAIEAAGFKEYVQFTHGGDNLVWSRKS